jgi:hypothetical protein
MLGGRVTGTGWRGRLRVLVCNPLAAGTSTRLAEISAELRHEQIVLLSGTQQPHKNMEELHIARHIVISAQKVKALSRQGAQASQWPSPRSTSPETALSKSTNHRRPSEAEYLQSESRTRWSTHAACPPTYHADRSTAETRHGVHNRSLNGWQLSCENFHQDAYHCSEETSTAGWA